MVYRSHGHFCAPRSTRVDVGSRSRHRSAPARAARTVRNGRCHCCADRDGCAQALSRRRLLVAVHLLHERAPLFRARGVRPNRGGAGGAAIPGDPPDARRRRADADGCQSARCAPDAGEPCPSARCSAPQEQARGGADRGQSPPATGCAGIDEEAARPAPSGVAFASRRGRSRFTIGTRTNSGCADARASPQAAGHHSAGARALQATVDDLSRGSRSAAACPGPASALGSHRGSRRSCRTRFVAAGSAPRKEEAGRDTVSTVRGCTTQCLAARSGCREEGSLAPRRRAVCVCRHRRTLRRARFPGNPSRHPVRRRRRHRCGKSPAPVSLPQCTRSGAVVWAAGRAGDFTVVSGTVCKWRGRFVVHRLDGLYDEPRLVPDARSPMHRSKT